MSITAVAFLSFIIGVSFNSLCAFIFHFYKTYTISHKIKRGVKQTDYYRPCTECTIEHTSEIGPYQIGSVMYFKNSNDVLVPVRTAGAYAVGDCSCLKYAVWETDTGTVEGELVARLTTVQE